MKITRFNKVSKGHLAGFFDLIINEFGAYLNGCSLFIKGNQRWVNLPTKEYTNTEGEKKYSAIFGMVDEERQKEFKRVALETVLAYCETNNIIL